MLNQDSEKVTKTKTKIKKAFLQLYKEKRIEKIGIKEITDIAGVNRGTFYAYYLDIYDLLEKIEEEAMEKLKNQCEPIITSLLSGTKLFFEIFPLQFFQDNKDLFHLFFGETASPKMINQIKKYAQGIVIAQLNLNCQDGSLESIRLRHALEYVSSGQIGLITHWFKNDMQLPISEMAILMEDINSNGALTYLLNHSRIN